MTMGEYPAPPGYPAAMSALPQQMYVPARWHMPKLVATVLSFVAAVLVVVASFLPLLSAKISAGSTVEEMSMTAWSMSSSSGDDLGDVPANGYPLVFAALFLVVAAALAWFAGSPSTTPGTHRLAGLLTSVGAAFLIGTVWTVSGQTVNSVDTVIEMGSLLPGLETEATYDVGFWLLLVAGLLALTATVLTLIPARQQQPAWASFPPRPTGQLVDVPVVHQLPPELPPVQQHLQVDPLTGQPFTQSLYNQLTPGNGFPAAPPPGVPPQAALPFQAAPHFTNPPPAPAQTSGYFPPPPPPSPPQAGPPQAASPASTPPAPPSPVEPPAPQATSPEAAPVAASPSASLPEVAPAAPAATAPEPVPAVASPPAAGPEPTTSATDQLPDPAPAPEQASGPANVEDKP